jgi:3-dehydroquinate synthase
MMLKLNVSLSHKNYDLHVGHNLLMSLGPKIKELYKGHRIAIITDDNVNLHYWKILKDNLEAEGYELYRIIVTPGEGSKSVDTLTELYNKLLDFGINKGSLIIALGGGVVGDLCGFAASTYLRGIPFIQVPTTLLSQVDSSIGGKVAVNLERGKNLIGSFYHPDAVFIDPQVLKTLPDRFFYDGMSEVIKYGAIKDSNLFNRLLNYPNKSELFENIDSVIYTCCNIKREIVEVDEKDNGDRMLLNFGHTLGHAIENYYNYEVYTHGEAVAIGMYIITKSSEKLGLTQAGSSDMIKEILQKYNLPWSLPPVDVEKLLSIMGLDKKASGKEFNLVLLNNIGDAFIHKIKVKEIRSYFNSLR